MAVTSAAPAPLTGKHRFWITDAALNNYRERGKPPSQLETPDKLAAYLDSLVIAGIAANQVEEIIDGDEEARLVRISDDPVLLALVKKSNNPSSADFAVVTVMTTQFADKKRANGQWSTPPFSVGGLSAVAKSKLRAVKPVEPRVEPVQQRTELTSTPPTGVAPQARQPGMYLILYRTKGDPTLHQIWANPVDVEEQMNGLNAVPGSVEVYKKMELGLRLLDP